MIEISSRVVFSGASNGRSFHQRPPNRVLLGFLGPRGFRGVLVVHPLQVGLKDLVGLVHPHFLVVHRILEVPAVLGDLMGLEERGLLGIFLEHLGFRAVLEVRKVPEVPVVPGDPEGWARSFRMLRVVLVLLAVLWDPGYLAVPMDPQSTGVCKRPLVVGERRFHRLQVGPAHQVDLIVRGRLEVLGHLGRRELRLGKHSPGLRLRRFGRIQRPGQVPQVLTRIPGARSRTRRVSSFGKQSSRSCVEPSGTLAKDPATGAGKRSALLVKRPEQTACSCRASELQSLPSEGPQCQWRRRKTLPF